MSLISRSPVLLLLLTSLCACAAKKPPADGAGFRDRSLITYEQLNAVAYPSAFEAVQALHGNWLRTRGFDSPDTPGMVWVLLNGVRLGGVETLRGISTQEISYIRFYDAASAGARWGRDMANGAIFVSTERR
jgi:hypothetical protein